MGGAGGVHFQTHMGHIRAQMCDGHLAVATLTLSLSELSNGGSPAGLHASLRPHERMNAQVNE